MSILSQQLEIDEPLYIGGYYRVIFDGQVYDLQARAASNGLAVLGNAIYIMEANFSAAGTIPVASLNEENLIGNLPIVPFGILADAGTWSDDNQEGGTRSNTRSNVEWDLCAEEGEHTISIIRLQADIKPMAPETLPLFYPVADINSMDSIIGTRLIDILNNIEQRLADLENDTATQWSDYPAIMGQDASY